MACAPVDDPGALIAVSARKWAATLLASRRFDGLPGDRWSWPIDQRADAASTRWSRFLAVASRRQALGGDFPRSAHPDRTMQRQQFSDGKWVCTTSRLGRADASPDTYPACGTARRHTLRWLGMSPREDCKWCRATPSVCARTLSVVQHHLRSPLRILCQSTTGTSALVFIR